MSYLKVLEDFLEHHLAQREKELPESASALKKSVRYSLFSGGKRFRPQLTFLAAEIFGLSFERVAPFAAAVEMIHTYSLMHDDLPAMDNDDLRRGQPTNHKVFGEDIALLGGDALLTEAFLVLAQYYGDQASVAAELVRLLSRAAGYTGMVAGQVIDMHFVAGKGQTGVLNKRQAEGSNIRSLDGLTPTESKPIHMDQLLKMHQLKTGALIKVSLEGVAVIAQASINDATQPLAGGGPASMSNRVALPADRQALADCGAHLGLAFQLADDLLDYGPNDLEASGWPKLLGVEKTKDWLNKSTQSAIAALDPFGDRAKPLRELVLSNQTRLK